FKLIAVASSAGQFQALDKRTFDITVFLTGKLGNYAISPDQSMNMLRSNSNNSKSSDRVALFSNSNNDTTSSLGRKVKHETDTPSQFEQQNDYRLDELNSKLSALHK
ncbi:7307_t:CDS:2, partial [Racocetra persica]